MIGRSGWAIRTLLLSLVPMLALAPASASGQAAYPSRPVRMIVPFAPGGASDVVARIMSPKLGELLGAQIVIENRPGASGNIGMEAAARAAPDGYTIYLGNIGTIAINPAIYRNLPVRPLQDLVPITQVADVPSILIASPSLPANSVAELIAWAKANPGALNFASTGSGALSRLEMEQLRTVAGLDLVHVPYKGGAGPAVTGMLAGETHVMFVTLPSALTFLASGKLKPLGISTAERIEAFPHVPTMAESGFPEMVSGAWQGMFAPAGTPRPIVEKLHAAIVATLAAPETVQRFAEVGVAVETSRSPEAFAAFVGAETMRWGKVAKASGATVD
jgi:tripartite-type tricarboxylate transporter receptor subunit TctC